jgi:hypothetical protein
MSEGAFKRAYELEFDAAALAEAERREANRQFWGGIPLNRRKTTLPDVPVRVVHGATTFSAAMKQAFVEPIRQTLARKPWVPEPDPWDEAVQWIEADQAARAEWPWPRRPR